MGGSNSSGHRVFLELGCPYCNKVAAFIGGAMLSDKVKIEIDNPQNAAYLMSVPGPGTFPAMELGYAGSKNFLYGSDAIIDYLARECGRNPVDLPLFEYYMKGTYNILLEYDAESDSTTTSLQWENATWNGNSWISDRIDGHLPPISSTSSVTGPVPTGTSWKEHFLAGELAKMPDQRMESQLLPGRTAKRCARC